MSRMLDRGYRITKDEPYNITFEKPSQNLAINLLMSTPMGGDPSMRLSYAIADIGGATRVVADMAIISNAGMAFERRTDVSQGADSPVVQQILDNVATDAQATASKPQTKR